MKMFYRILFPVLFLLSSTWAISVTAQDVSSTFQKPLSKPVTLTNGYFQYEDGRRYFPLGFFGSYFEDSLANEQQGTESQHGDHVLAFQQMPVSVWRRFFETLKSQGYTAIRMFPSGDYNGFAVGGAVDGLDIGGRVNHPLLKTMFKYFDVASEYGLKVQLCLFSSMEYSFYCHPDRRCYWGIRRYTPEEIAAAPEYQRRFLQNPDDLVSYNDYFSDKDVIACNKQFLDEIIPLIRNNPNIFMVELSNELGWAGPHAKPGNTFRWEISEQYLMWARTMVEHIHQLAPDLPVCISNPGVGILGHDPIQWYKETGINLFSMHIYPDICGTAPGSDFAQIADISLRYVQLAGTSMYGEWQLTGMKDNALPVVRKGQNVTRARYEQLLARDIVWFTMLSGAPGCIAWRAPSYGEYAMARDVFENLNGRDLSLAKNELKINIGSIIEKMIAISNKGNETCQFTESRWCPDHSATDGKHYFCTKMMSDEYNALLNIETWSLETGAGFILTQGTDGIPVTNISREDFLKKPVPLKTPEGYQVKTMRTADEHTLLIYLRNYQKNSVMKTNDKTPAFELFALRTQNPVPLTLHFTLDTQYTQYELKILDLDTRQWLDSQTVSEKSIVELGITSHDYVLVLTH
jgi:hypothetical protein